MNSIALKLCSLVLIFFSYTSAVATPLTDPSQLDPTAQLIDFESFAIGPISNPLVIGPVTFSTAIELSIFDATPFGANGTEITDNTLTTRPTGAAGDTLPLTITFAQPMIQILLGWFDANNPGNSLTAFDAGGAAIETFTITDLGPAGGSDATWVGIESLVGIASVLLNPGDPRDFFSIDNVHYTPQQNQVPEPATALLLAVGGAALVRKKSLRAK